MLVLEHESFVVRISISLLRHGCACASCQLGQSARDSPKIFVTFLLAQYSEIAEILIKFGTSSVDDGKKV